MSWLSRQWDSVTNYVQNDLVSDLGDAAEYVYSGEIVTDTVYVAEKAYETGAYIVENPLHAGHVALEGVQHGLGTVAGLAGGAVLGIGGLAADSFNTTVRTLSFGNLELYKGGYGTMAMAGFSTGSDAVSGAFVGGTDYLLSTVGVDDPTIKNEYDVIIMGATKGVTEVAGSIALVAATGGLGAAALGGSGMATAGGLITSTYATNTALLITGAGTAYAVGAGIDEQFKIVEADTARLLQTAGIPDADTKPEPVPVTTSNEFKPFAFGN